MWKENLQNPGKRGKKKDNIISYLKNTIQISKTEKTESIYSRKDIEQMPGTKVEDKKENKKK